MERAAAADEGRGGGEGPGERPQAPRRPEGGAGRGDGEGARSAGGYHARERGERRHRRRVA